MITFDGDRSKKRKWFANRQLAIIKDIDVPAKAVQWDGFTFRVWQQEDLSGGRITAPMGAVVVCSTADSVKISIADSWISGFSGEQELWVIFKDLGISGEFTTFFQGEIASITGYYQVKFNPVIGTSWFGLVNGDTIGPDSVEIDNYPCAPIPIPWMGETYNIMINGTMKYDLDGNGIYDWFRHVFEKNTSPYLATGKQASRINCVARHIERADTYDPLYTYQKTGADKYTSYQGAWKYDFVDGIKIVGSDIDVITNTVNGIKFSDILNTDMPETLRLILTYSLNDGSCEPIGSYATDTMFFHAVNASTYIWYGVVEECAAKDYYDENPGNDNWRLFYSMTVNGVVYLVNYGQFGALLNTLSLHGTAGNWHDAMRMFTQLTAAYPNCNWTVPYDSVMFHAHDGNLYTWTRAYGAVQISTTGITIASLNVPVEVLEDGVRPEITYAGTFETVPLYLCICNKVKEKIKAVYVGSPFGTWTKLPGVDDGLTLIHVRPCKVTPTSIFLIGIIKETVIVNGVPTDYYNFASLDWRVNEEMVASTNLWMKMGRLPFTVGDNDNLQVGLYGDDIRVNDLAAYLSPPPILPQFPVGPYDKYAIGLP